MQTLQRTGRRPCWEVMSELSEWRKEHSPGAKGGQREGKRCCRQRSLSVEIQPGNITLVFAVLVIGARAFTLRCVCPQPFLSFETGLSKSLSCSGWTWTCHPRTSASQGAKAYATTSSWLLFWYLIVFTSKVWVWHWDLVCLQHSVWIEDQQKARQVVRDSSPALGTWPLLEWQWTKTC